MANAFTVTARKAWRFSGTSGKQLLRQTGILVIDTTATGGAVAGDLPASMFSLTEIHGPVSIVLSTNAKVYPGVPAYDNGSLMVVGGASQAPMDLPNGTYSVTIDGLI